MKRQARQHKGGISVLDGLLIGGGGFRQEIGTLLAGDQTYYLADALSHTLDATQGFVWYGIDNEHSFRRNVAYISKSHPNTELVDSSASFMIKRGVKITLLSRGSGRLTLKMSYHTIT